MYDEQLISTFNDDGERCLLCPYCGGTDFSESDDECPDCDPLEEDFQEIKKQAEDDGLDFSLGGSRGKCPPLERLGAPSERDVMNSLINNQ